MKYLIGMTIIGVAFLAAGCASQDNAHLLEARSAYERAVNDPHVQENAPVALREAEQMLARAEEAGDEQDLTHYAYMTQKKVEVAENIAEFKAAEKEIVDLRSEREQYLADMREREADQARQQAREAIQAKETAQQQYEQRLRQEEQAQLEEQRRAVEEHKTALQQQREELERERLAAQQAKSEAEQLQNELAELKSEQTNRGLLITLEGVLFETNQSTLKPGAANSLDRLAAALQKHGDQKVIIEGHTDSQGDETYNQRLSEERAESVARFLRSRGIAADRIAIRGYGEIYPVASNDSPVGRQQNRRVEIILPQSEEELRGYFGDEPSSFSK